MSEEMDRSSNLTLKERVSGGSRRAESLRAEFISMSDCRVLNNSAARWRIWMQFVKSNQKKFDKKWRNESINKGSLDGQGLLLSKKKKTWKSFCCKVLDRIFKSSSNRKPMRFFFLSFWMCMILTFLKILARLVMLHWLSVSRCWYHKRS